MAKLANLARMTTATTGTGTITLGSAVASFLAFAAAGVADGDVVSYAIEDGLNREVGTGAYSSTGPTLTRTVLASTNGGAAINLSGNAQVFVTALAQDLQRASAADVRAAAAKLFSADLIAAASALVTLTDAATVAIDWSAFVVGDLTVAGNRTIGNPTNVQPGVSRAFFVFGDSATERSIVWGSAYKGNLPAETVTSTRGLLIALTPRNSGLIGVSYLVLG